PVPAGRGAGPGAVVVDLQSAARGVQALLSTDGAAAESAVAQVPDRAAFGAARPAQHQGDTDAADAGNVGSHPGSVDGASRAGGAGQAGQRQASAEARLFVPGGGHATVARLPERRASRRVRFAV